MVVTTPASNVFADRDVLQAVVRVLTARFGGISDDAVEGNVFEARTSSRSSAATAEAVMS